MAKESNSYPFKLKEDNIQLENTLEAESESHVNRLSRELSALRIAHHQLQQQQQQQNQLPSQSYSPQEPSSPSLRNNNGSSSAIGFISPGTSPDSRRGPRAFASSGRWGLDPGEPSAEMMLEAMRRENEHLRNKLVDTERDYIRISRLNEIYREELIVHRRRVSFFAVVYFPFLWILIFSSLLVGSTSRQLDWLELFRSLFAANASEIVFWTGLFL